MNKKPSTTDRSIRVHLPLNLPSKLTTKITFKTSSDNHSIDTSQQHSPLAAYQHALIKTHVRCCEILDPLSSLDMTIYGNASVLINLDNQHQTKRYLEWGPNNDIVPPLQINSILTPAKIYPQFIDGQIRSSTHNNQMLAYPFQESLSRALLQQKNFKNQSAGPFKSTKDRVNTAQDSLRAKTTLIKQRRRNYQLVAVNRTEPTSIDCQVKKELVPSYETLNQMILRRNLELPKVTQSKMDLLFRIKQVANEMNTVFPTQKKIDYTIGSLETFRKHFSNQRPTQTTLENLGSVRSSQEGCSPTQFHLSRKETTTADQHDIPICEPETKFRDSIMQDDHSAQGENDDFKIDPTFDTIVSQIQNTDISPIKRNPFADFINSIVSRGPQPIQSRQTNNLSKNSKLRFTFLQAKTPKPQVKDPLETKFYLHTHGVNIDLKKDPILKFCVNEQLRDQIKPNTRRTVATSPLSVYQKNKIVIGNIRLRVNEKIQTEVNSPKFQMFNTLQKTWVTVENTYSPAFEPSKPRKQEKPIMPMYTAVHTSINSGHETVCLMDSSYL